MKKQEKKSLRIQRETVRSLTENNLEAVNGGGRHTSANYACNYSFCICD